MNTSMTLVSLHYMYKVSRVYHYQLPHFYAYSCPTIQIDYKCETEIEFEIAFGYSGFSNYWLWFYFGSVDLGLDSCIFTLVVVLGVFLELSITFDHSVYILNELNDGYRIYIDLCGIHHYKAQAGSLEVLGQKINVPFVFVVIHIDYFFVCFFFFFDCDCCKALW